MMNIDKKITEVFNQAVANLSNRDEDGMIDWCRVDADMHLDLPGYESKVLVDAMNVLADRLEEQETLLLG